MLKGTSTLLVGGPGSGKTYSLASFARAGKELFVLFTEPGGEESLLQAVKDHNIDIGLVHWKYIAPASPTWDMMKKSANTISQMSYEGLTSIKAGINKQGYSQFIQLLETLADFKCDRDGKSYGAVDSWEADRAFALDSLSGLNIMAMDMVVGSKPVKHQGEWGVAMDNEERLVQKLCSDVRAFFVLTAHIERETNELSGAQQLMAGALGRKLAPRLPRFFSDVIHAYRDGAEFFWSTTSMNVDLKARTVPLQDKMAPDFGIVVNAWKARVETASTASPTPQPPTNVGQGASAA
jgi:hypothetical protein